MYNTDALQTAFAGLVGFFQPYDPAYPDLLPALTQSASGRYVQMTHPLCTVETLYNVAPEFGKFSYPAWVDQAYSSSAIVSRGGEIYRASAAITIGYPAPGETGSTLWVKADKFSIWLQDIYRDAVMKVCTSIVQKKKLEYGNRTLIDSLILFDGIGTLNDRIINSAKFVGLSIQISRQDGLQLSIDKLGLQLDGAPGNIDLYLYHSSSSAALGTFVVNVNAANTFVWQKINNAILKYFDDSHDTDGIFYLGYYQSDLGSVQAIKRLTPWGAGPCYGCNEFNAKSYGKWSKHLRIQPFSVLETYAGAARSLFDTSKVNYEVDTNYGLNLALTVQCDLTSFFIQNKDLFADALVGQIVMKCLEAIGYTQRMTAVADQVRSMAMADIDPTYKGGFAAKQDRAIAALSLDMSGISSDCLPCQDAKGIKMGAV